MLWILGSGVAERGELRMTAAEDALVRGEAQAARQELAAAWVYFGAPLYDEAWRGEEIARKRHQDRWGAVARKLAVLLHHLWVTHETYVPLMNHHKVEAA